MHWKTRRSRNMASSAAGIYRNWLEYICAQKETALVIRMKTEAARLRDTSSVVSA